MTESQKTGRGAFARLRAARRRISLFTSPESPRARGVTLTALVILAGGLALISASAGLMVAPSLTLTVPLVLGGFLLERGALRILVAAVAVAFAAEVADFGWRGVRAGSAIVLAVVAAIAVEFARERERTGLSVGRGESILIELRDQLRQQGELLDLPTGWEADVAQRSAGGSTFGGDFIVSTLGDHGKLLELAVVDVSGKGLDAATRALLLSGALGGLLGGVAPERFLEAANDYLLRQGWDEGFATALHLTVDLVSGHYTLRNAGHPPAAHFVAGSGRWLTVESTGMALGLSPAATFGVDEGQLAPNDALLLYTDGLIEVPGRDLDLGIDRLLGAAEALIPRGFTGGAAVLVDAVAPHSADDRAVVLFCRT